MSRARAVLVVVGGVLALLGPAPAYADGPVPEVPTSINVGWWCC